jgi:hypothetical protein
MYTLTTHAGNWHTGSEPVALAVKIIQTAVNGRKNTFDCRDKIQL